jgi:hypothetical protein
MIDCKMKCPRRHTFQGETARATQDFTKSPETLSGKKSDASSIRGRGRVHRGAAALRAAIVGAATTPLRDDSGCYGYLIDAPDLHAVLAVNKYVAGQTASANQKLFDHAQSDSRRFLLAIIPDDGGDNDFREVDVNYALLTGYENHYHNQQMWNFNFFCCTRPFSLVSEPTTSREEKKQCQQVGLGL